jgi:hypothetical protein
MQFTRTADYTRLNYNKNLDTVIELNMRVHAKVSGLSHNEINNNKRSLRSNTKGYGGKTHQNDTQNSNTTAPSGREL